MDIQISRDDRSSEARGDRDLRSDSLAQSSHLECSRSLARQMDIRRHEEHSPDEFFGTERLQDSQVYFALIKTRKERVHLLILSFRSRLTGDHCRRSRADQSTGIVGTQSNRGEKRIESRGDERRNLRRDLSGDHIDLRVGPSLSIEKNAEFQSVRFFVQSIDPFLRFVENQFLTKIQVFLQDGQILRLGAVEFADEDLQFQSVFFFHGRRTRVGLGEKRRLFTLRLRHDPADRRRHFVGDLFGASTRIFVDLLMRGALKANGVSTRKAPKRDAYRVYSSVPPSSACSPCSPSIDFPC